MTSMQHCRLENSSKDRQRFTAVFKKVATFNIDFASRDGNRAHQNAYRSCDNSFVHKTKEIELRKHGDGKIECTPLRSKDWLAVLWFHEFKCFFEVLFFLGKN